MNGFVFPCESKLWPTCLCMLPVSQTSIGKLDEFRRACCLNQNELMDHSDLRWSKIKHDAPKLAFLKFSFRKFWAHMSVFFRDEARYPHLLKLVAVVLLVIMDTTINECHFCHMNRIHTGPRNRLKIRYKAVICSMGIQFFDAAFYAG